CIEPYPDHYQIFHNDAPIESDDWDGSVTEVATTTTTTTTTTTITTETTTETTTSDTGTTNTDEPNPFADMSVYLIPGLAIGAIIIVIIVIARRRT
ncbi:MAG: hypothetical protein P1Q69_19095, partial [Candidatus Thorarchaeota archaeon]|nr:hypothetical protein [Candidatus Thorarchaeota archaeon]